MPGNDLTTLRSAVPVSATQQATARANITTILNGILDDIEPKVTPAGLDMSSSLSFLSSGVYSPITNLGYLGLQNRAATPAVNGSFYQKSGNAYYRNGSGTDIALTDALGVVGAPGNITGVANPGYGSGDVEVNYNLSSDEYRMKGGAATHALSDVVLDRARFSDGSTYYATLGASASMASTLAYSLPVAFPASTSVMTLSNSGTMDSTRDISIDSVTATGDVVGDDVGFSGTRYMTVHAFAGQAELESGSFIGSGGRLYWAASSAASELYIPINLPEGTEIVTVECSQRPVGTAPGQISIFVTDSDGSNTTITGGSSSFASGSAGVLRQDTLTPTTYTLGADEGIIIYYNPTAASDQVSQVKIGYTRALP